MGKIIVSVSSEASRRSLFVHFGHTHYAQEIIEALVYEFFQSLLLTDSEATILVMNASYLVEISQKV